MERIEFKNWPRSRVQALKPNYIHEASIALAAPESSREFFIKNPNKFGTTKEELQARYRDYDQFMHRVWAKVDELLAGQAKLKEFLQLEFLYSSETPLFPALIVSELDGGHLWGTEITYPTVDELAASLKQAWHRVLVSLTDEETESIEVDADFDGALLRIEQRMAETDFSDFARVVELIMQSENDGDVKIKLIELHQNESWIFQAAAKLLVELAPFIEEAGKPIRPAMKALRDSVATDENWQGLVKKLSSSLSIQLNTQTQAYLRPQLMWPQAISLYASKPGQVHMGIGIYALELMERTDIVEDRFNTIIEGTKILSDPSRLKIVMLLQSRSMYLKELADHLELSSATLSHHVQNMVNKSLLRVDISHQSRRVYYSLNPEAFTELGRLISELGETT